MTGVDQVELAHKGRVLVSVFALGEANLHVLSEAEHRGDGERLGPVGGRIVAEVSIGIIDADPASYGSRQPDWTPSLPARGERFELADMPIPLAQR
jgi:hypothetical protein